MEKPSPQFIRKLEEELRLAYRAQYQAQRAPAHPLGNFFKFFVPAFSGLLVAALIILNFNGGIFQNSQQQNPQQSGDAATLATFDEGQEEEQIAQDFDNQELSQIDSGVKLVAEGNY